MQNKQRARWELRRCWIGACIEISRDDALQSVNAAALVFSTVTEYVGDELQLQQQRGVDATLDTALLASSSDLNDSASSGPSRQHRSSGKRHAECAQCDL